MCRGGGRVLRRSVGPYIWNLTAHIQRNTITFVSYARFLNQNFRSCLSETFAGLTATIRFRRRTMYYIFQMYIPCICVVILSWVSFWIDETDGSDRVGLGIATVLTISFMRGSMNDSVPRVSYLKSVDYFLLGSFVFVFMTLIEYVLVLKQTRKEKKRKNEKNKETIARDRQREAELLFPESEDEKVTYYMAQSP